MAEGRSFSRKGFIKSAVNGMMGMTLLGTTADKLSVSAMKLESADTEFIYRTLGRTGLRLPIISMGVLNANNPNLVRAALDAGIVHLDTAHGYQRGRNETMIGDVVKERPRDSFVIATKVPGNRRQGGAAARDSFLEKFDVSLKRLGLEYVDILYLHGSTSRGETLFEPFLNALEKVKKAGKTRFVGVSTHGNEPEVIQAAIDSKLYDVVLTALNFKQDHHQEVSKAIGKAAQAGLGVVVMKAIAGTVAGRADTSGVNARAAIKWALRDPNVTTVIPGMSTFDHLALDLSVMEGLNLTEAEKEDLKLQSSTGGLYCQGCRRCLPQCPYNLPIPDLMRAYMYTYGYRNLEAASDLLLSLNLTADACSRCDTCSVDCAKGFDISRRVRDVIRLQDVPRDFIA